VSKLFRVPVRDADLFKPVPMRLESVDRGRRARLRLVTLGLGVIVAGLLAPVAWAFLRALAHVAVACR
jgi:hypothetical protein